MTLKEYKELEPDEQTSFLSRKGVSVAERQVGPYLIVLYQVEGFYVEVFYSRCYEEETLIICFDDPGLLEPYFSFIDINEVYAVLALH